MPHVDKPYKYEMLTEYPHMRPADVSIWQRFIQNNPDRFLRVWYDFRVGDSAAIHEGCSECARGAWHDLTRWQVDVIGETDKAFYIIEVKPNANARALGQAQAYALLFEEEMKPQKPVIPVVLTDHEISTTSRLAKREGIEFWVA